MVSVSDSPRRPIHFLVAMCILILVIVSLWPRISSVTRAQEKRITIDLYPSGDSEKTNPVVLSFNGKLYDDLLLTETRERSQLSDDEKFLAKVIAANSKGTLDDVLLLWDPKERQDIRTMASDPKVFEANRRLFSSIEKSYLKAKIYYGTHVIFIVKHLDRTSGERLKDYPIKKVQGEYFLTNTLREDPVFQYLTTKYINKLREH